MEPLRVPGTLDSLSLIADYVKAAAAKASLSNKAAYNLRLAIDEIATNIVIYGYERSGMQGVIDLSSALSDHALTITLEDTGVAYDPRQALEREEATLDDPLEERPIGGLGIYLAIQGVDRFLYERVGDRNRNIFTVNRPVSPP